MSKINYEKLQLSLERLKEQYKNYLQIEEQGLSSIREESIKEGIKEGMKESCIQRFEVCYSVLWKSLKKYLEHEGALEQAPHGPKSLFRLTHKSGFVDEGTLARLLDYVDKRVAVTHDYSGEKAGEVLEVVGSFIEDVENIYRIISKNDN